MNNKIKKHLFSILIIFYCLSNINADELYSSLTREKQEGLITDAMLAAAAYDGGKIPNGYRRATKEEFARYIGNISDIKYDPATGHFNAKSWANGLDGALLINETTGEIVLSFAGTDSLSDFGADVEQAVGGIPTEYKNASEMLEHLIANTNQTQKIKVVGHSLGGGLATYATLSNYSSKVTTTTFNPAGLSVAASIFGLVNKNTSSITNVCNGGDAVSKYGKLYGKTYLVPNDDLLVVPEHDTWWESVLLSSFDAVATAASTIIESTLSHSINTLITDMRLLLNQDDTSKVLTDEASGGEDKKTPSGDNIVNNDDATSSTTNDSIVNNDDNSTPNGDNVTAVNETTNTSDEYDSSISLVDVANDVADHFAIVLPNIPHYRLLWIFSGESLGSSVKSLWDGFSNKSGNGNVSELKSNLKLIKGIGND